MMMIILLLLSLTSPIEIFGQNFNFHPNLPQLSGLNRLAASVEGFANCLFKSDENDKYLGFLPRNESYFCTPQTQRLPVGLVCCSPETSETIRFILSTPDGSVKSREVKYFSKNIADILLNEERVVYIVHGYLDRVSSSKYINKTRDGYLKRGSAVVVIDWSQLNQLSYWQSIANVRTVGAAIGYSILNWNIPDKTLLVGFSLGGQIVGEIGKYVNKYGNGKQIAECHALDPAGPWFDPLYGFLNDMQLDKADCRVVQVIHSSASYNGHTSTPQAALVRFGTAFKSGHCDFWINCGHNQLLCDLDLNGAELIHGLTNIPKDGGEAALYFLLSKACSHYRSAEMYADAVNKDCLNNYPIGSICPNCGQTLPNIFGGRHECYARPDLGMKPFPPDNVCTPNDDVNYVVFSTRHAPYCQGNQFE